MKKLIFVDFDDTLCLHSSWVSYQTLLLAGNDMTLDILKDSVPNYPLIEYLEKESEDPETAIFLISASCSLFIPYKKRWCDQYCSKVRFTDYIGSSIEASKAIIMEGYRRQYNLKPEDVIYIDDWATERKAALEYNFKVYSPTYFNIMFTSAK